MPWVEGISPSAGSLPPFEPLRQPSHSCSQWPATACSSFKAQLNGLLFQEAFPGHPQPGPVASSGFPWPLCSSRRCTEPRRCGGLCHVCVCPPPVWSFSCARTSPVQPWGPGIWGQHTQLSACLRNVGSGVVLWTLTRTSRWGHQTKDPE